MGSLPESPLKPVPFRKRDTVAFKHPLFGGAGRRGMNATAIILLIGVCGFWLAGILLVVLLARLRKTVEVLEATMQNVNIQLQSLSPVLSGTMQQLEVTGRHISRTAGEVETLVHGINSSGMTPVAAGAVNYLPLAFGLFRLLKPLFSGRKGRER